MQTTGLMEMAA